MHHSNTMRSYMNKKDFPIPWTEPYNKHRFDFIDRTLDNPQMMKLFASQKKLPPDFGFGIDERCVEIPWIFSQLTTGNKRILDAGSALNHEYIVKKEIWQNKQFHIMTLAPEGNCFWKRGISYIFGDLRDIPIKDHFYDTVISISTLEHVGFDNTMFINSKQYAEHRPDDFLAVVNEIQRILKPKGTFLLTLPFGKYQNLGIAQQFDSDLLDKLVGAFSPSYFQKTFYKYSENGWSLSSEEDCKDCLFLEWLADCFRTSDKRLPDPVPKAEDFAAGARSVACVKMVKA